MTYSSNITMYVEDPALQIDANELAQLFKIHLTAERRLQEWQLCFSKQGLVLYPPQEMKFSPYQIDFTNSQIDKRRREFGSKNILAKAIGYKAGQTSRVIDLTAGLGRDGFLLASLGCEVLLVEQNPVLAMMLQEAIKYASRHEKISEIAGRLKLIWADSRLLLNEKQVDEFNADVIYIDPMFPQREKSALVKKDMQILQQIVGYSQDADSLLDLAFQCAKRRIVVKRPRVGPYLAHQAPDLQLFNKTHRFDIYLIKENKR